MPSVDDQRVSRKLVALKYSRHGNVGSSVTLNLCVLSAVILYEPSFESVVCTSAILFSFD